MEKEVRYTTILAENKDHIYRICRCYVQDPDVLKDTYQQVLVNLWQNLDSFEGRSKISTWIYRITVNTCLTLLKSEQRRHKMFVATGELPDENNLVRETEESATGNEENLQLLYDCISQLAPLEKTLISLYLEDLSTGEMSDVLGISEANVRVKIHRIKKSLKVALERKHHGFG